MACIQLWPGFSAFLLPSSSSVNLICKENTTRHRPPLSKARFSLLRLSLNARFLFQNTAIHNYSKFTRSHLGKRATYTTFFESFYSITIKTSPRNNENYISLIDLHDTRLWRFTWPIPIPLQPIFWWRSRWVTRRTYNTTWTKFKPRKNVHN